MAVEYSVRPAGMPDEEWTLECQGLTRSTVAQLYRTGNQYVKAGVGLIEILVRRHHQFDMLEPGQPVKSDKLIDLTQQQWTLV